MGIRKRWAWSKIDWDQQLREGMVIEERHLPMINATEMVEILRIRGVRAHRGLDRAVLERMLLTTNDPNSPRPQIDDPVDTIRARLHWFTQRFTTQIQDQLSPSCDLNCREAHQAESLYCYEANRDRIETALRDAKEERENEE